MPVAQGKERLILTDLNNFKSIQAIEQKPLFNHRYNALSNIIDNFIDKKYRFFLAQPEVTDEKVVWFGKRYIETPKTLSNLDQEEKIKYEKLKEETLNHYKKIIAELNNKGESLKAEYLEKAIKYVNDDFLYCYDDIVVLGVWGMNVKENLNLNVVIEEKYFPIEVEFIVGDKGSSDDSLKFEKKKGDLIEEAEVPIIQANEAYIFIGWDKEPVGYQLEDTISFTAIFDEKPKLVREEPQPVQQEIYTVKFTSDKGGLLVGKTEYRKLEGEFITLNEVPEIETNKNFKFIGWSESPVDYTVTGNKEFKAIFDEIPLSERIKAFFQNNKWWKWLLWILLFLLILFLLSFLFKNCAGEKEVKDPVSTEIVNGDPVKSPENEGSGGSERKDLAKENGINPGESEGIYTDDLDNIDRIYNPENPYNPLPETPAEYKNYLPPKEAELPVIANPTIIEEPGKPKIIADRLNILMDNNEYSIKDLARSFKEQYPEEKYQVIYYNDVVKRLQLLVPTEEREHLKVDIPNRITDFGELFIFDESLFEVESNFNDPIFSNKENSWFYKFINAQQAWTITTGSSDVTIAIVDNSFNLNHPEFTDTPNKIVKPYNVWKHSNEISIAKIDHGTHVAGLALAIANNNKGLSGIAPNSKFMPIQVANDDDLITTTSVLDGVLYAIYQGADVINVSLGNPFVGLDEYSENEQRDLLYNYFKEEQRLWNKVGQIAEAYNAIIVVAAGNDNVLAGITPIQRPKNILVVAAVDKDSQSISKSEFSNYGDYVTASAPGVSMFSAYKNDYEVFEGTSMAAPLVSGAIALMRSIDSTLTAEKAICILQNTGKKTSGRAGNLIQIDKALLALKNNVEDCGSNLINEKIIDASELERLKAKKKQLESELKEVNEKIDNLK